MTNHSILYGRWSFKGKDTTCYGLLIIHEHSISDDLKPGQNNTVVGQNYTFAPIVPRAFCRCPGVVSADVTVEAIKCFYSGFQMGVVRQEDGLNLMTLSSPMMHCSTLLESFSIILPHYCIILARLEIIWNRMLNCSWMFIDPKQVVANML